MDRFNIYLLDGNVLDAKVYGPHEGLNSFIFGPSEETSKSLKNMHYNRKVKINYYIRNNKNIKEEPIEISIGKLIEMIGIDYIALGPPQIYFVDSIDDLFNSF